MEELDSFERKVLATIRRYRLIEPGERVLVAVSGGPDSMALLRTLDALSDVEGFDIAVFHLDHMLRGEESASDARFVHRVAEIMHVKSYVFAYDVARFARERKLSIEEAGRAVRYRLMNQVAEREGFDRIAVAHHLDDRVETFLMRLIRGASLEGLASIPVRRDRVVRPLYEATKSEILRYLKRIGQDYRVDRTNLGADNLRARVRNEILPLMLAENPNFKRLVAENLEGVREDAAFLDALARVRFEKLASEEDGLVRLSIDALTSLPRPLALRVLKHAYLRAGGDAKALTRTHLEDLYGGLRHRTGFELDLPRRMLAVTEYGDLLLGYAPRLLREEIEPLTIDGPGEFRVLPTPYTLRVGVEDAEGGRPAVSADPAVFVGDADRVPFPLVVRSWHKGDRFVPFGMEGSKKVHDLFVDKKIPRRLRKQVPLVFDAEGRLVWVAGIRASEAARVTAETARLLRMELVKER